MNTLEVENLQVYFRTRSGPAKAVDGVSFQIEKGTTHALVGESGCGKSVTALSIAGLLPLSSIQHMSGSIRLDGEELMGMDRKSYRSYRGSRVAMIFQEPMTALNPVMRVGKQIEEAILQYPSRFPGSTGSGDRIPGEALRKRVYELMDVTGLRDVEHLAKKYPHELSGGMRQRIMIAMALSCRPDLLIADEPTTALDVTIQRQILDLLDDLRKETGSTVLLITHDLGVVARMAKTTTVLYAGQVVEEGRTKDIFEQPLHPYTEALFGALPSAHMSRREKLHAIPGAVPPATRYDDLPSPCRFYERCPYQDDRCFKKSDRIGHNAYCARKQRTG